MKLIKRLKITPQTFLLKHDCIVYYEEVFIILDRDKGLFGAARIYNLMNIEGNIINREKVELLGYWKTNDDYKEEFYDKYPELFI